MIDIEQLEIEQRHVFGLEHFLLSGCQLVLGRNQLDSILHSQGELLVRKVVTLTGIVLLLQGSDVAGLVGEGAEIG